MAAILATTKSFSIGVDDGWTQIITGAATPINFLRVSAYPHTHPFQIAAAASKPTTAPGVNVCHDPFKVYSDTNGISSIFWIKVNSPGNQNGKVRIDVYAQGGVLS